MLPIVRSLAQHSEVRQRLWRNFRGAVLNSKRLAWKIRRSSMAEKPLGADWIGTLLWANSEDRFLS
jgi:hypothetical protein